MTIFAVFIDGPWRDAIICLGDCTNETPVSVSKTYVLPKFAEVAFGTPPTGEPSAVTYELKEIVGGCAVYRIKAEALAPAGHHAAAD